MPQQLHSVFDLRVSGACMSRIHLPDSCIYTVHIFFYTSHQRRRAR